MQGKYFSRFRIKRDPQFLTQIIPIKVCNWSCNRSRDSPLDARAGVASIWHPMVNLNLKVAHGRTLSKRSTGHETPPIRDTPLAEGKAITCLTNDSSAGLVMEKQNLPVRRTTPCKFLIQQLPTDHERSVDSNSWFPKGGASVSPMIESLRDITKTP